MSIQAINWAFQQRELKPAMKLVLVCLADCHNGHTGQCDPTQITLAEQCEMGRSTLNRHLNTLEDLGLIRRIQRSNKRTNRQQNTFYILGFDEKNIRDVEKAVSYIGTRKKAKAVSQKAGFPCPKKRQSRVPPVGHKPELNRKEQGAGAREASELDGIAKFWADRIKAGLGVTSSAIAVGTAQRMLQLDLVSEDDLRKHRISW